MPKGGLDFEKNVFEFLKLKNVTKFDEIISKWLGVSRVKVTTERPGSRGIPLLEIFRAWLFIIPLATIKNMR